MNSRKLTHGEIVRSIESVAEFLEGCKPPVQPEAQQLREAVAALAQQAQPTCKHGKTLPHDVVVIHGYNDDEGECPGSQQEQPDYATSFDFYETNDAWAPGGSDHHYFIRYGTNLAATTEVPVEIWEAFKDALCKAT